MLEKIDHECSLRSELKPDWAVRPAGLMDFGETADCLLILQGLYGRARELAIPFLAFRFVLAGGRELAVGSGYSGIGESTIVNESPKPLVAECPHQQAQRGVYLTRAALGILNRFLFPVLLPFSREPSGASRLTARSSEQQV